MVKKKIPNFFFRKKNVVAEKKKIVGLNKKKKEVQSFLMDLLDIYDLPPDLFQRLPFYYFDSINLFKEHDEINYLNLREELIKEHSLKTDELKTIISEIQISKIDLALAKINCMENELNKMIDGYIK